MCVRIDLCDTRFVRIDFVTPGVSPFHAVPLSNCQFCPNTCVPLRVQFCGACQCARTAMLCCCGHFHQYRVQGRPHFPTPESNHWLQCSLKGSLQHSLHIRYSCSLKGSLQHSLNIRYSCSSKGSLQQSLHIRYSCSLKGSLQHSLNIRYNCSLKGSLHTRYSPLTSKTTTTEQHRFSPFPILLFPITCISGRQHPAYKRDAMLYRLHVTSRHFTSLQFSNSNSIEFKPRAKFFPRCIDSTVSLSVCHNTMCVLP